jgi:hypothetical protein
MTNRVNLQDVLQKDKLEVSTFLIYKEEYRKLSSDAKMVYQYLLKRFSVSEHGLAEAMKEDNMENFSFIDEKGDLFCFVSNDELRFVLGISEKSVIKAKKELKAVKLLEEEKQTAHKTNRLYVNKVVMDVKDQHSFKADLKAFREAEQAKRKLKNAKRNTKKTEAKTEEVKVEEKVNCKYCGSVNCKNGSSVNCKNYRQSTKEEGLSTEEPKSTKESILTEVSNSNVIEMPTKLVVKKNIDRIVQDKIDIQDIIVFYLSTDNMLADHDFNNVLDNVLQFTKGNIGNIKNLLKKAVNTYMDEVKEDAPVEAPAQTSPNGILMFNWLEA